MKAEFIYQPTSGEYEEKTFDLNTVWKSQIWSWTKFTTKDGIEWIGAFRGEPKKTVIAEKINQVAVLTSDGLYILDIDKRETLFFDQQTEFRELAELPTKDKFIIADYDQIGIIDKDFKTKYLNLDFGIDNIVFRNYIGTKLRINFEKLPDYDIIDGVLNTENWKIETE
ncbi:hypothetical protein [Polaribacter butkevichii]|uniref:hypothetical protein n=1 Tax=Polaribacter butkevichii TaxID=218490 RepID=UPI0030FCBDFA